MKEIVLNPLMELVKLENRGIFYCALCHKLLQNIGAMRCPTCKDKFPLTFTTDIVEPPWKAYNILTKMHYPYEESMRYDRVRDTVAERGPGWENLQEALVTLDPARARDDPVIVKNIPYYQARKTVGVEVMKLEPPARPQNWGWPVLQDLSLPLDESCWSEDDLKDPKKSYEMTVLLNAQKEMASKFLDAQWEAKWHENKVTQILEEKVQPYIQNAESSGLSEPIVIRTPQNLEKSQRRWWWF